MYNCIALGNTQVWDIIVCFLKTHLLLCALQSWHTHHYNTVCIIKLLKYNNRLPICFTKASVHSHDACKCTDVQGSLSHEMSLVCESSLRPCVIASCRCRMFDHNVSPWKCSVLYIRHFALSLTLSYHLMKHFLLMCLLPNRHLWAWSH